MLHSGTNNPDGSHTSFWYEHWSEKCTTVEEAMNAKDTFSSLCYSECNGKKDWASLESSQESGVNDGVREGGLYRRYLLIAFNSGPSRSLAVFPPCRSIPEAAHHDLHRFDLTVL
ncbi:hypothetical protein F2Q69_00002597 [Brassica cretica]|uniref:Uncharacterized protein n=1 Tax=Brassica cretica TaxID=69181 RepID=A0A8S9PJ25_BRACR|nr:hypothetical protein F2Q69_00002597 [Brassica cretica]